ncbi:MAG: pyridoxamine 5'-phosphate oxidase family protein [Clostridia bacterium]|nr:pyridoxamine 5'-phosphate oxidase family protein [Clostridia bacterium]
MMKKCLALLCALLMLTALIPSALCEEEPMSNLAFFESLNFDNGLEVVTRVFERFPLQYAATLGTDGNPQIRPIEFKFEQDGVLYFDTVVFYSTYAELLAHPYIQLCICDQETMTYVRLGGKVNFTKDEDIINRCFEESPVLTSQFGDRREFVIGYYLTEVWAEFNSFSESLPRQVYYLPNRFDEEAAK